MKTPKLCVVMLIRTITILIGLNLIAAVSAEGGEVWKVTLRSTMALPASANDQNNQTFSVSGLSGITYLGGRQYAAVMDNSNKVVLADVHIDDEGSIQSASFLDSLTLSDTNDFEGIAFAGGDSNQIYLAEESSPGVHRYRLDNGQYSGSLPVPTVFESRVVNQGFESLTITPDRTRMWTANEQALTIDGPLATATAGTIVRLLAYDIDDQTITPGGQYAYQVEPIHGDPIRGSRSGLVDLITMPDGSLLALERSLAISEDGLFNTSIFAIDFEGATDVTAFADGLANQTFTSVSKQELWSGTIVPGGMNLEGLTLGPRLAADSARPSWALVGVVDDGDPISKSTVVSFEITAVPEPSSTPSMLFLWAIPIWSARRSRAIPCRSKSLNGCS